VWNTVRDVASYATKIIVRRIGRRYRAGARSAAARGGPHAVRVTRLGPHSPGAEPEGRPLAAAVGGVRRGACRGAYLALIRSSASTTRCPPNNSIRGGHVD
jgi:hypothetical protein